MLLQNMGWLVTRSTAAKVGHARCKLAGFAAARAHATLLAKRPHACKSATNHWLGRAGRDFGHLALCTNPMLAIAHANLRSDLCCTCYWLAALLQTDGPQTLRDEGMIAYADSPEHLISTVTAKHVPDSLSKQCN